MAYSSKTSDSGPQMTNPRLRHLPSGEPKTSRYRREGSLVRQTSKSFDEDVNRFTNWLKKRLGEEWIIEAPQISPARIIEEVNYHPYYAALMCRQACIILNVGHHARVREYMVAAYVIALALKNNERHIEFVASKTQDGRSSVEGMNVKKFKTKILHYLFIFIFKQSGMLKRNRAWQWADSLQAYFDEDREPAEVEGALKLYGQNKLRIAALKAKKLREAREQVAQVEGPLSRHIDVLLLETERKTAQKPSSDAGETDVVNPVPHDLARLDVSWNGDEHDDDSSTEWEGDGEGIGNESPEQSEERTIAGSDDQDDLIDGRTLDDRLEKILLGTMSLGAKLAQRDFGREQQSELLPMVLLLSTEIVKIRQMIAGV